MPSLGSLLPTGKIYYFRKPEFPQISFCAHDHLGKLRSGEKFSKPKKKEQPDEKTCACCGSSDDANGERPEFCGWQPPTTWTVRQPLPGNRLHGVIVSNLRGRG